MQIEIAPFTLRIGRVSSANIGTLLPADSEPVKVFDGRVQKLAARPRRIKVFIAQYEGAAMVYASVVCGPERARVSNMQETGRRGRQAAAIRTNLWLKDWQTKIVN